MKLTDLYWNQFLKQNSVLCGHVPAVSKVPKFQVQGLETIPKWLVPMKSSCYCLYSVQLRTDTNHKSLAFNILTDCKSHLWEKWSVFKNMLYVILWKKKYFAIHSILIMLLLAFLVKEMITHIINKSMYKKRQ